MAAWHLTLLTACTTLVPSLADTSSPPCVYVADGSPNSDRANKCTSQNSLFPEEIDQLVARTDIHVAGTRCCHDTELPTNECELNGSYEPCQAVPWAQAHAFCTNKGPGWRLCTVDEILTPLNGYEPTSCQYKWMHVRASLRVALSLCELSLCVFLSQLWTSTEAVCEDDDVDDSTQACVWIADGSPTQDKANKCSEHNANYPESTDTIIVNPASDTAGVRCCQDNGSPFNVCDNGICEAVSWAEAQSRCAREGGRLCTRNEVLFGPVPLGCLYKFMHVWTSDQATCVDTDDDDTCEGEFTPITAPATTPALYLVNVKQNSIIAEIQPDTTMDDNRMVFYLENIDGVNSTDDLTIVATYDTATTTTVRFTLELPYFENVDMSDWSDEKLASVQFPEAVRLDVTRTAADGFSLNGVDCTSYVGGGELRLGLDRGVYLVTATPDQGTPLSAEFRLYATQDGNPVALNQRPILSGSDGVPNGINTILHIAPYATMPKLDWPERPYPDTFDRINRVNDVNLYEEAYRINMVVPWENDVYICMELTAAIYKVSGKVGHDSRTATLQATGKQVWFDVYDAVEQATQLEGKGPPRVLDFSHKQHTGLRTIAFHPTYSNGTGYVYTAVLETRPGTDDSGSERQCDSSAAIPASWQYIGDFVVDRNEASYACGEAVVLEWFINNDQVVLSSYRQLVRFSYSKTGVDSIEYEHPIKQIMFAPNSNYLWIQSGDGSIDSKVAFGGQSKDVFGKLLRVDVGQGGGLDFEYTIPPDNYAGIHVNDTGTPYPDTVCAVGFRNPHSLGFFNDPTSPHYGKMIMFDGGRDNAEEVNIVDGCGQNYGWSNREGIYTQYDWLSGQQDGIGPLPANDAQFGYRYPATFFGHTGSPSNSFGGQCGVGSFPIETQGSELFNYFVFTDFPREGFTYMATVDDLMNAKQVGEPSELTQAPVYGAHIHLYESASAYYGLAQPILETFEFRDVARLRDADFYANLGNGRPMQRVDARFGKGAFGELLMISKRAGQIFTVLNSLPANVVGYETD